VTTAARAGVLPEVPAIGEFVPGYEASGWYGLGAPRTTPAEVINRLNAETNAALATPKLSGRLGYSTFVSSVADYTTMIARETDKWAKVLKFAGLKQE